MLWHVFNLDRLHANMMFTDLFEYLQEEIRMNLSSIVFKESSIFSISKKN